MAARQNHRRRQSHARDQKSQHDVIAKVHSRRPRPAKVARDRDIKCDKTT
jgi:hypothetical protein